MVYLTKLFGKVDSVFGFLEFGLANRYYGMKSTKSPFSPFSI